MPRLTDVAIRNAKPPERGQTELRDNKVSGLMLRISEGGTRTWALQLYVSGRRRRFKIGEYPALSLAEARVKAEKMRVEAQEGRDPIRERRQAVTETSVALTVRRLLDAYASMHLRANLRTAAQRERDLSTALKPMFDKPAKDLDGAELQAIVDEKAKTAPIAANRLRAALLAFLRWSARRRHVSPDLANIAKPAKERTRDRVLAVAEMRRIYEAAPTLGWPFGHIVRLLVLTAQRRGDVAGIRVGELDLDARRWSIPGTRTKNGKPHIVHLSGPALSILRECIALRSAKEGGLKPESLLFTTNGVRPVSGFSRAHSRLLELVAPHLTATDARKTPVTGKGARRRKRPQSQPSTSEMDKIASFTLHDFRTAFATAMAEAGHAENVIDKTLNHVGSASAASTVARVYNRADLLPQRAQVLEAWAALVSGERGEVVNFQGAAPGA